ncbi:MAG: glutamate--cysteine ligase [Thermoleophilia bacterium]|nr:glutamate--cysteine ligase [Thermoleophilia bacterium]
MSEGMSSEWPNDCRDGTIGVEEEFLLVDPSNGEPMPHIEAVIAGSTGRLTREFVQELVESSTPVCSSSDMLLDAMIDLRGGLAADAARSGSTIAGVGVHAFAAPENLTLTDTDRYREMSGTLPWTWREATTCGMHVHVGVSDADRAIEVCDRLRSYLPVLLAMSVNSPLWRGNKTGMRSVRTALRRLQPRTGMPPRLGSWAAFTQRMRAFAQAGVPDGSWIWWGVRPHATFGTVEVRVFDTQSDVRNAHALAAATAALVEHILDTTEADDPFTVYDDELLAESWYNAMRDGTGGTHVMGTHDDLRTQLLGESALDLAELLEPRLGDDVTGRLRVLALWPEANMQVRDFEHVGVAGAMRAAALRTTACVTSVHSARPTVTL